MRMCRRVSTQWWPQPFGRRLTNQTKTTLLRPSAPIQLNRGVQMSELDAGVISCELPVSDGVIFVARLDPRGDLAHQVGFIGDT